MINVVSPILLANQSINTKDSVSTAKQHKERLETAVGLYNWGFRENSGGHAKVGAVRRESGRCGCCAIGALKHLLPPINLTRRHSEHSSTIWTNFRVNGGRVHIGGRDEVFKCTNRAAEAPPRSPSRCTTHRNE